MEGTWYEISGPDGVVESGSMDITGMEEKDAKKKAKRYFSDFIKGHTVATMEHDSTVKFVAWDQERKDYIQLQSIKTGEADYYIIQEYNNDLVFLKEYETDVWYHDEIKGYIKGRYEVQRGLPAEVFRSELGDCTNGGISSEARELYILGCETSPFYPTDLRQCVTIEGSDVMGEHYVSVKPVVHRKRWYMAGGNFLYTSDSRYKEITGISYPVSIHDRYEGGNSNEKIRSMERP